MKRLFLFFLLATSVAAQGSRHDGFVITTAGRPVAGASIRVCVSSSSGTPGTQLATIYSDRIGTLLTNPTTTDANGNYFFFAVPGRYDVQISGIGINTVTMRDVAVPIDPTGGVTTATLVVTTTATIDTLTVGRLNNILFVDGVKYTTIASALTAALDGDIIFIPRGNYSVALDALSVSKSVRFVGAGVNSTVITFTGASGVAFKFIYDDNVPTGSYTDWGAGIENCQIIGPGTINGGAGNVGTGIQLGDATHSSIGAYFRNVIIAGFALGTTWSQGGPQAIASWGTKFDHVTWLNNNQQVLFNYSGSGTGLAHIEFVHPTFNHYQAGVTMQANAVQLAGTIGGDFNLINPYFQSDQLVVSSNRVKLVNPTFENTNGQSTTTYVSHTGGDLEMVNPHFLQTGTGATVPTAYVTSSAGHLGMVNPGGNNSSATTFPAIALSGSVNVDIYGFRGITGASALFSGSTSGYLNSPNPSTGRQQFGGNDLVDINSDQTIQLKNIKPYAVNNTLFVDGVKYPFTAAGLQACINDATPGKICDASAMPSFTSTVQITVGNASAQPVTLILPNSSTWTFNITDGTSSGIKQFNKSIIRSNASVSNGLQMSLEPSGAGTNMRALYSTDRTQTDGYYYAEGFLARNTVGATFSHGLIEITHAADNSVFRNISAINSSGVGIKIYEVCCGTSFYNLTGDGVSGAGAKPVRIGDSTLGAFTIGGGAVNVGFYGLSATHPGNNEYTIELGDSTNTSTRNAFVENVQFYNLYMEGHSSNTTTPGLKIWDDVHGIGVFGLNWNATAGGSTAYAIDLDSWAGPSNSVFLNVKSQTYNVINDNITGRTITGASNYGQAPSYFSGDIISRRFRSSGTALVAGDFALSAGWGDGPATIGTITGTDQAWQGTITATGVNQGSNPTLTLTFKDGTWTNAPICSSKVNGGTGAVLPLTDAPTATTNVITFVGTPVTTLTYQIVSVCIGR